jgi:hypothetical protein
MPDWVADKQMRLDKIREAKPELEADANVAAAKAKRRREEVEKNRLAEGRKKSGKTPKPPNQQDAAKLHRSREPRALDHGRLHPGQRADRRRLQKPRSFGARPDAA